MNEAQVPALPELKEEMINCSLRAAQSGFLSMNLQHPGVTHSAEWDNCHEIYISTLFWLCIFGCSSRCLHSEHMIQVAGQVKLIQEITTVSCVSLFVYRMSYIWNILVNVLPQGSRYPRNPHYLEDNTGPRGESEEKATQFFTGDARKETT